GCGRRLRETCQSTFAPEALTTAAQRPTSVLMISPNCSGVLGAQGSMPNFTSNARNSSVFWKRCISAFNRATTAGGVPPVATTPCQACQSKPGSVAEIGGTSGISTDCLPAEVPSAVILPP